MSIIWCVTCIMDMVKEQHADKSISMGLAYMTICKSYEGSKSTMVILDMII